VRQHFGRFFDDNIPPELQFFSFREGIVKPSASLLRRAMNIAATPAESCIAIGDSYTADIQPAAALGMKTIWLLHRAEREVESLVRVLNGSAQPPTRTIRSIADLNADVVSSLCTARTG
jgi:FMN phosphatase YigB (HAD superfamily)